MDCNGGIRDDDSDVDIETITDTDWSVEMPGHSIQNISSTSAPISTEPLVGYQNIITRVTTSVDIHFDDIPIARSYGIKKMPSRKSGQISVSQASSLYSKNDNSAARCFVTLGQEPKLLSDKQLTRVQSQPKYTPVRNSMRCHISAATSATTAVRSTQLARRTYIRNPAIRAIDKEGSYQCYLHKRIKRLTSTMTTYAHNVDREIRLHHFALDSFMSDFDHEFALVKSKVGSNDYQSQLKLLSSKFKSSALDIAKSRIMLNCTLKSYADDLIQKITLLNSKIDSYAHDLGMQITLMNSKINSFVFDINQKRKIMISKSKTIGDHLWNEFELLMSGRVVM